MPDDVNAVQSCADWIHSTLVAKKCGNDYSENVNTIDGKSGDSPFVYFKAVYRIRSEEAGISPSTIAKEFKLPGWRQYAIRREDVNRQGCTNVAFIGADGGAAFMGSVSADGSFSGRGRLWTDLIVYLTRSQDGTGVLESKLSPQATQGEIERRLASDGASPVKLFAFRSDHGHYMSAEDTGFAGVVHTMREGVGGDWEVFGVFELGNDLVAILPRSGFYLQAINGGGGGVQSVRKDLGAWETWKRRDEGNGRFSFQSNAGNGLYLTDNGNGELVADRNVREAWQKWTLEQQSL